MAKATTPKKRANGTGSIYRNGDRWRVAIPYTDPVTGLTRQKVQSAKTREQAEAMLVDSVRARDAGIDLTSTTLEAFLTRWLGTQRLRVRPSTIRAQDIHIRRYIVPALGRQPMSKITSNDVERMMAGMVERGLSAATARHARMTLQKALGTAERDGLVSRNVARSVELPRLQHREMTALTDEEMTKLIDAAAEADTAIGDIVIVAVTTGLRQGELLGLSWADAHLDEAYLDVRNNLTRASDGGWEIGETKTTKSRRHVDLAPDAIDALRRQKVRQLEAKLVAGAAWRESGLVFTNEIGEHLVAWNVTKAFQALSARAGVRKVRFHDLRHTAASYWLRRGLSLNTVSKTLGHTSIAITADVYGHVSPAERRETAAAMAALRTQA